MSSSLSAVVVHSLPEVPDRRASAAPKVPQEPIYWAMKAGWGVNLGGGGFAIVIIVLASIGIISPSGLPIAMGSVALAVCVAFGIALYALRDFIPMRAQINNLRLENESYQTENQNHRQLNEVQGRLNEAQAVQITALTEENNRFNQELVTLQEENKRFQETQNELTHLAASERGIEELEKKNLEELVGIIKTILDQKSVKLAEMDGEIGELKKIELDCGLNLGKIKEILDRLESLLGLQDLVNKIKEDNPEIVSRAEKLLQKKRPE